MIEQERIDRIKSMVDLKALADDPPQGLYTRG